MYTPSKLTATSFPFNESESVNVFLYHPIPIGKKPLDSPPNLSNAPSMLQSWGRSNCRQALSSYVVSLNSGLSPSINLQSLLNLVFCLTDVRILFSCPTDMVVKMKSRFTNMQIMDNYLITLIPHLK